MTTHNSSWVFPTVKTLVTLVYYFLLVVLLVFTGMGLLKFLQLQSDRFKPGEDLPNSVTVSVSWGAADNKNLVATGDPRILLKPEKSTGQLQVPIRSVPGLLSMALGLVGLGTAVWTFLLLRRIFRTVRVESPFHADQARRITTMGLIFLGQTGLETILKLALRKEVIPYLDRIHQQFGTHPFLDITLGGQWLLGLILLALAQVYRRGIELQVENELTV